MCAPEWGASATAFAPSPTTDPAKTDGDHSRSSRSCQRLMCVACLEVRARPVEAVVSSIAASSPRRGNTQWSFRWVILSRRWGTELLHDSTQAAGPAGCAFPVAARRGIGAGHSATAADVTTCRPTRAARAPRNRLQAQPGTGRRHRIESRPPARTLASVRIAPRPHPDITAIGPRRCAHPPKRQPDLSKTNSRQPREPPRPRKRGVDTPPARSARSRAGGRGRRIEVAAVQTRRRGAVFAYALIRAGCRIEFSTARVISGGCGGRDWEGADVLSALRVRRPPPRGARSRLRDHDEGGAAPPVGTIHSRRRVPVTSPPANAGGRPPRSAKTLPTTIDARKSDPGFLAASGNPPPQAGLPSHTVRRTELPVRRTTTRSRRRKAGRRRGRSAPRKARRRRHPPLHAALVP